MKKEEAIKTLEEMIEYQWGFIDNEYPSCIYACRIAIEALKSQLDGEWIVEQDKEGKTYGRCSRCGMKNYAGATMYCPDCGALMSKEKPYPCYTCEVDYKKEGCCCKEFAEYKGWIKEEDTDDRSK